MAVTVTNAQVDALAAAVPAGSYGPLTRVSDVETYPVPNSEMEIELTSIHSVSLFMTFDELGIAAVVERISNMAHDWTAKVDDLIFEIDAINDLAVAMSAPHTYANWKTLITALRAIRETKDI